MRQIPRAVLLVGAAAAACAVASSAHAATSVAYLDGNEVWVASPDGSNKTRLSGGEGDWLAVSQNAQGWVVGVQKEAGKLFDFSRFTLWNAQGDVATQGPLGRDTAGPSYVYPLGLEVTSTGGNLLYGFSALTPGFPIGSLRTGFFVTIPSAAALAPTPIAGSSANSGVPTYFSLVSDRVVGRLTDTSIGIQDASSVAAKTFTPWSIFDLPVGTLGYRGFDASSDATVVATELATTASGQSSVKIAFWRTTGLGGSYVHDCIADLPFDTVTGHPTVSPDGALVAWQQAGGVKVTGTPDLRSGGPVDCELPAPTTISATGSYPSLGGFDAAAFALKKNPPAGVPGGTTNPGGGAGSGGGSGAPAAPALKVKLGAGPKLSNGSSNASLKITPGASGTAKVAITIAPKSVGQKGKTPISLATGSKKVTAGKQATVKLKPSKKAKALKKKLKGKKATITISVGTAVFTGTIKLG